MCACHPGRRGPAVSLPAGGRGERAGGLPPPSLSGGGRLLSPDRPGPAWALVEIGSPHCTVSAQWPVRVWQMRTELSSVCCYMQGSLQSYKVPLMMAKPNRVVCFNA